MTSGTYSPFFSVCVPSFNSGRFLPDAIESVLSQSCDDFELLIQDDASTDDTDQLIEKYNDPRIYYKKNESNLGIFGNLNEVCRRARGQYIKVLCADDMLAINCLKTIQDVVNDHETKPKLISVKESGDRSCLNNRHVLSDLYIFTIHRNNLFRFLSEKDNWGGGLAELCVEREFFQKRNYFGNSDKQQDFSRDIIVWFEMVLETEALMINEPLVYQRQHSGQARYKLPRINQLREMLEFFYGRERELKPLTEFEAGRKNYLDRYMMSHYWYGIKSLLKGRGISYLNQVSWLKRQYNHSDVPLSTALLRVIERFVPARV